MRTKAGQIKNAIRYEIESNKQVAAVGQAASEMGKSAMPHEHGVRFRAQVFPKRPTMGLALEKLRPKLTGFWAASLVQS